MGIWNASTHTDKTIGGDDFRWLFRCLRRGMKTKSLADKHQFDRIDKRRQHERQGRTNTESKTDSFEKSS